MKRTMAITLSLLLIISPGVMAYAADGSKYTDMKTGNWAYEAVAAMSGVGIAKGYPDGSFKPSGTVTYGEFIKMALIADTKQDAGNSITGHWALGYHEKAMEEGYFTKYDIPAVALNISIPRGDMALIVSSILGDVKIEGYDKLQAKVKDVDSKTKHDYDIIKAYASGILTGYGDNTFRPEGTLTRAEAATVIYRLTDESKRELPNLEDTAVEAYKIVNTADYFDPATVKDFYHVDSDFTAKAELYREASLVGLKIRKAWTPEWGSSFDHTMSAFVYLVKNGKIVSYCQTIPMYDDEGDFLDYYSSATGEKGYDVALADYIIAVPTVSSPDGVLVKIVPNPFKAK